KVEVSRAVPQGKFSPVKVEPDDLLLIQFTSGTTAHPKGAMLTHDNMLRDARHAADLRGGRRARTDGAREVHPRLGQRHHLPDADGARGFPAAPAQPA